MNTAYVDGISGFTALRAYGSKSFSSLSALDSVGSESERSAHAIRSSFKPGYPAPERGSLSQSSAGSMYGVRRLTF